MSSDGPVWSSACGAATARNCRLLPSMVAAKLDRPTPARLRRHRNSRLPMRRAAKERALSAMKPLRSFGLLITERTLLFCGAGTYRGSGGSRIGFGLTKYDALLPKGGLVVKINLPAYSAPARMNRTRV